MTEPGYRRPLPVVRDDSRPFWDALRERRLIIQTCERCGRNQFYPRSVCRYCGGSALRWIESTGRGRIYTFSVVYRPPTPEYAADVPYALGLVDLDEGVRMLTNVLDDDPDSLAIGDRVEVVFDEVTPDVTLAKFRRLRAATR